MNYGFTLDSGEQITRIVRRHIFSLLPTLCTSFALAFIAAFFAYFGGRYPEAVPLPSVMLLAVAGIMATLAAIIFLVGFKVYRDNVLIFTNLHLIHSERLALFQKRVSQLSFLRVEDVTGRRVGFLQNLFNYGEVEVQSAGETVKFVFKYAPHPESIADQALHIHEECVREAGDDNRLVGD